MREITERVRRTLVVTSMFVLFSQIMLLGLIGERVTQIGALCNATEEILVQDDERFFEQVLLNQNTMQLNSIKESWSYYSEKFQVRNEKGEIDEEKLQDFLELTLNRMYSFNQQTRKNYVVKSNGDFVSHFRPFDKNGNTVNSVEAYLNLEENKGRPCIRAFTEDLMVDTEYTGKEFMVSLFIEPNIENYKESSNFEKYPLGQYNRNFFQKILLPYAGKERQEQLIVFLGFNEQDVWGFRNATHLTLVDKKAELNVVTDRIIIYCFLMMLLTIFSVYFVSTLMRRIIHDSKN